MADTANPRIREEYPCGDICWFSDNLEAPSGFRGLSSNVKGLAAAQWNIPVVTCNFFKNLLEFSSFNMENLLQFIFLFMDLLLSSIKDLRA